MSAAFFAALMPFAGEACAQLNAVDSQLRIPAKISAPPDDMFIDIDIREHQVYLGEPLRIEYDVYVAQQRGQVYYDVQDPEFTSWYAIEAEPQIASNVTVEGKKYLKEPFAVFYITPTTAGKLTIPYLSAQVPYLPGRPWITHDMHVVEVIPTPLPRPAHFMLQNVGKFEIRATLSNKSIRVGDTIVVNIELTSDAPAPGLQLAEYRLGPLDEAFKLFPIQKDGFEEKASDNGIQSVVRFHMRLVALKSGTWSLPPVKISTFDPDQHKYKVVTSDPIELNVGASDIPPVIKIPGTMIPAFRDEKIVPIELVPREEEVSPYIWLHLVIPPILLFLFIIAFTKHNDIVHNRKKSAKIHKLNTLREDIFSTGDAREQLRAFREMTKIVFNTTVNVSEKQLHEQFKNIITEKEQNAAFPVLHKLLQNAASSHQPLNHADARVILEVIENHCDVKMDKKP